jgi:hypothetical protein
MFRANNFSRICKAMGFTRFAVADATILNFHLLFETNRWPVARARIDNSRTGRSSLWLCRVSVPVIEVEGGITKSSPCEQCGQARYL